MNEALQNGIAFWLQHPWWALLIYALGSFAGGFANAAGRDLFQAIKERKL